MASKRDLVDPVTGEIKETAEVIAAALAEIRTKMAAHVKANEGFRYPRDDDQFLLAFLRARKYEVDRVSALLPPLCRLPV